MRWVGGGGTRIVKELPSQIVNEVVIWGLLIQNSLPGKNAIRIETVAILVYFYKDKPSDLAKGKCENLQKKLMA